MLALWSGGLAERRPRHSSLAGVRPNALEGLGQVVNNTRFLILPWVKVPGLASHILSRAVRRLNAGLAAQIRPPGLAGGNLRGPGPLCGHGLSGGQLAAVGQTQGRGRQGPDPRVRSTSIKEVFVYPLHRHFRQRLQAASASHPSEPQGA